MEAKKLVGRPEVMEQRLHLGSTEAYINRIGELEKQISSTIEKKNKLETSKLEGDEFGKQSSELEAMIVGLRAIRDNLLKEVGRNIYECVQYGKLAFSLQVREDVVYERYRNELQTEPEYMVRAIDKVTEVTVQNQTENELIIYTDGGASGNPGKGGYGFVIVRNGQEVYSGHNIKPYEQVTNQRMELLAAVSALSSEPIVFANPKPSKITVRSDSKYLVETMNSNWTRGIHYDLWDDIDKAVTSAECPVDWQWIKRASDPFNVRADKLSNQVR